MTSPTSPKYWDKWSIDKSLPDDSSTRSSSSETRQYFKHTPIHGSPSPRYTTIVPSTPYSLFTVFDDNVPDIEEVYHELRPLQHDLEKILSRPLSMYTKKYLGKGTFGVVYEYVGANIVVKHALDWRCLTKSFLREVVTMNALRACPCVTQIIWFDPRQGDIFMKKADSDLWTWIQTHGHRATMDQLRPIMGQIETGMVSIHLRGFWHRDIKPENILVDGNMYQPSIYITDFGLTVPTPNEYVPHTNPVYTLWYRAPEILQSTDNKLYDGVCCDIFALGIVFLDIVTRGQCNVLHGEKEKDQLVLFRTHLTYEKDFRILIHPWCTDDRIIDLLFRMLCLDPVFRIGHPAIVLHEFFNHHSSSYFFDSLLLDRIKKVPNWRYPRVLPFDKFFPVLSDPSLVFVEQSVAQEYTLVACWVTQHPEIQSLPNVVPLALMILRHYIQVHHIEHNLADLAFPALYIATIFIEENRRTSRLTWPVSLRVDYRSLVVEMVKTVTPIMSTETAMDILSTRLSIDRLPFDFLWPPLLTILDCLPLSLIMTPWEIANICHRLLEASLSADKQVIFYDIPHHFVEAMTHSYVHTMKIDDTATNYLITNIKLLPNTNVDRIAFSREPQPSLSLFTNLSSAIHEGIDVSKATVGAPVLLAKSNHWIDTEEKKKNSVGPETIF